MKKRLVFNVLFSLLLCAGAGAGDKFDKLRERVDACVNQLKSDEYAKREHAHNDIKQIILAQDWLNDERTAQRLFDYLKEVHKDSDDPEVKTRLERLFPLLQFRITKVVDDSFPGAADRLSSGDISRRIRMIRKLSGLKCQETVPVLVVMLQDRCGEVNAAAAYALGRLRSPKAIPYLIDGLKADHVSPPSMWVLARMGEETVPPLMEALTSKKLDMLQRMHAATLLGMMKDKKAIPPLIQALTDPDPSVRAKAAYALGHLGANEAVPALIRRLDDEHVYAMEHAAMALGMLHSKEAVEPLAKLLTECGWSSFHIAGALGEIGDERALPALISALKSDNCWKRRSAARALGKLNAKKAIEPLKQALGVEKDYHYQAKEDMLKALLELKPPDILKLLLSALEDKSGVVCYSAGRMLARLGEEAVESLKNIVTDGDETLSKRSFALQALSMMKDEKLSPFFIGILSDGKENEELRIEALKALRHLKAKDAGPAIVRILKEEKSNKLLIEGAMAVTEVKIEEAANQLVQLLYSPNAQVRYHACWGLKVLDLKLLNRERAVKALLKVLKNGKCRGYWVAEAFANIGPASVSSLKEVIGDGTLSAGARLYAIIALGEIGEEEAVESLLSALRDANPVLRQYAAEALGKIGGKSLAGHLVQHLKDKEDRVRAEVIRALGKTKDDRAMQYVTAALEERPRDIRWAAVDALGELGTKEAIDLLIGLLDSDDEWTACRAAHALGKIGDRRAVKPLIRALYDQYYVTCGAIEALGKLRAKEAIEPLIEMLEDEYDRVRKAARETLVLFGEDALEPLKKALSKYSYQETTKLIRETIELVKKSKSADK